MDKRVLLGGLALLLFGLLGSFGCAKALAQEPGQEDDDRRKISVSGTGSTRVKPDIASAVLGVSKSAPKLPDAKAAADAAIAKVRAAVRNAGVAEEEIRSVQYQIYRVQPNPQAGIREATWKVVHMLQVRTKKPDSIASIVDAAVAAGATDVQNIGFTVDQLAPHRVKSRELAVQAAKEKAQQLASLTGVHLGDVISISETGDYYPMAQMSVNARFDMDEGMGGAGSGISGGQIEVTTNVQVVYGIR